MKRCRALTLAMLFPAVLASFGGCSGGRRTMVDMSGEVDSPGPVTAREQVASMPGTISVATLNGRLSGRPCLIEHGEHGVTQAWNVVVRPDSILWRNFEGGVGRGLATSDVTRITVHHEERDIAKGGMKGILIGTVCGALIGSMIATTDDGESIDLSISQGAAFFGFVGAGVGGIVGLAVGDEEKVDHYDFPGEGR